MKLSKTGKIVGAVLLIGGIVAVVVIRRDSSGTELVVPPRPLKTMEIGAEALTTTTALPGRVAAGDEVTMSFNASGTLIELPVKEGDKVKKGQLLAQMDQRDAKNQVDAAVFELQRAAAQLDRMRIAAEAKAVSLQELSNAEATYAIAVARQNIAQKALEDTVLLASFDGVIARVMVKNFETVQSLQPIVSLQDLSGIEISASVPEYRVARLRG
ncbi:MAG: efflux RND transporter periplasmic adaptor subunit, partial [Kiritimatiellaceae bacterium]|nr:efflux RND transporter periplasmic adaptor subunit [Kiritimatiellaceae bacterium]